MDRKAPLGTMRQPPWGGARLARSIRRRPQHAALREFSDERPAEACLQRHDPTVRPEAWTYTFRRARRARPQERRLAGTAEPVRALRLRPWLYVEVTSHAIPGAARGHSGRELGVHRVLIFSRSLRDETAIGGVLHGRIKRRRFPPRVRHPAGDQPSTISTMFKSRCAP